MTIPEGTVAAVWWIIARADGDDIVAETVETNNTMSRSISIGADLVMTGFTVPSFAAAGQVLTVSDTTRNQGAGTAAASTTSFYLSSNSSYDALDMLLASRAVPALAAGASDTASTTLTIPAGTAAGTWYVIARADAGGVVGELYETNNTLARTVSIGPDLQITSVTAPPSVASGGTLAVNDTTRNLGAATAGASTTRFYLSTNSLFDAGDVLLGSRAVPVLAQNASSAGSTSLVIPAGTAPGYYYVFVVADGEGVIAESEESNNRNFAIVQVTAP